MKWFGSGQPHRVAAHNLLLKVVGTILLLAGLAVVAMAGRSLVLYRAAVARHGGDVVAAADAGPSAGMHGSVVHVAGMLRVLEPPRDEAFGLSAVTPVLTRYVEMFQWREVRLGSTVHYEMDWFDHPLDARHFEHPANHANPGDFPVQGKQFDAGRVQLGRFVLSPELLHALPGSEPVAPDIKHLPANLAASFSLYRGALVTSTDPANPRLGDVRVHWEAVPVQLVTVFARQDGDQLVRAPDATNGKGYDVQIGEHALSDMLADVPAPPELLTLRRVLAVLLASLGIYALLWARGRRGGHDGPVALGLGTLTVGAVACAQWLGNDGLLAMEWLALGVAGGALAIIWRLRYRRS